MTIMPQEDETRRNNGYEDESLTHRRQSNGTFTSIS